MPLIEVPPAPLLEPFFFAQRRDAAGIFDGASGSGVKSRHTYTLDVNSERPSAFWLRVASSEAAMLRLRRLTGLLIALAGLKALAAIQEAGRGSRSKASRPTSGRAVHSSSVPASSVGPERLDDVTPLDCDRAAQSSRSHADQESSVLRTGTASGVALDVCRASEGSQRSDLGKSRPRLISAPPLRFGYFMFGGLWLALGGFFVWNSIGEVGEPPMADKVETAAPIEVQHPAAPTNVEAPKLPLEGERSEPQSQTLRGVPEVIDTSTLLLSGKIVHLFGVQSTEGGKPEDLERYLAGRAVACTSTDGAGSFRCEVEGRDISQVVLFNGGGRANADATPQLREAENRARAQRIGVWSER